MEIPDEITEQFLKDHPEVVYVFSENAQRVGPIDVGNLTYHRQARGFITKRSMNDYFTPDNYIDTYLREISHLRKFIKNSKSIFIIGLTANKEFNKFGIYEAVIGPTIRALLSDCSNVLFQ